MSRRESNDFLFFASLYKYVKSLYKYVKSLYKYVKYDEDLK